MSEQQQQLFEVDYSVTTTGVTVIRAESAEQAQAIVEDVDNWIQLQWGCSIPRPVTIVKVQPCLKEGETADNEGAAIIRVPYIVPAPKPTKAKKSKKVS